MLFFLETPVLKFAHLPYSRRITQTDNGNASLSLNKTNEHLYGLQMDITGDKNITSNELNKGGLHLNPRGLDKGAINFIRRTKKSLQQLDR